MLNRNQCQELAKAITEGKPALYGAVPYVPFDYARVDLGREVSSAAEESERVVVPGACIITGTPESDWLARQTTGGVFTVSGKRIRMFENAQVVGWRSLITEKGFFSSARLWLNNDIEKVLTSLDDGYAWADGKLFRPTLLKGESNELSGRGLFLTYLEPGNYGSFIFRVLPKLLYALSHNVKFEYIVAPDRSQALRQALDVLGLNDVPLITCRETIGVLCKCLYVIDDFDAEGVFDSRTLKRLEEFTKVALNTSPDKYAKKIYVSRRLNAGPRPRYRPLINEVDVEKAMLKEGFRIVYPETYGFLEQINIFANADIVVGPSGSGMLSAVFCKSGTRILDIESFTYTVAQHAKVYGSTGKRFGFAFGQLEESSDHKPQRAWLVGVDDVLLGLSRLL